MTQTMEAQLRQCLDRIVRKILAPEAEIAKLSRLPAPCSSWYAAEVVTVRLTTDQTHKVFWKNYSAFRQVKPGMAERRERERLVYRDLLRQANLGTARYYGSHWNPASNRFWLFLEYVEGEPLALAASEHWAAVARWLGRLHAHFDAHPELIASRDFLQKRDRAFYQEQAHRAQAVVAHLHPALAVRLRQALRVHDRLLAILNHQPMGFLHGACRPEEILLDSRSTPPRVCAVDWELAAWGIPLYDFAVLSDGYDRSVVTTLWESYRHGADDQTHLVPSEPDMWRLVNGLRLQRVLNWLTQCEDRHYPPQKMAELVEHAEFLCRGIDRLF